MARRASIKGSLPALLRIFRRLWPWIGRQKPLIAGTVATMLGAVVLSLAEPWPLKLIIDRVTGDSASSAFPRLSAAADVDTELLIVLCAVAVVILSGLRAVTEFYKALGLAKISNRVLREVRSHVYRHLQGLSLSFHTKARSGDLIVRVTRDTSMLRDVTADAVLPLLTNTLVLLGMGAVMLALQWQLALVAMATVPVYWLVTVRLGRGIHEAARKQRRREGALAATASESIHAIKEVQALGLEGAFAEQFHGSSDASQKEDMKVARLSARLGRTVDVLLAVATALVLGIGARLVLDDQMSAGDLVVFLTYLKRAFNPAKDFAKYAGRLAKAVAAGERVLELLDHAPEVRDLPGARPAPQFRGALRFEAVGFGYEPERPVLREIDLEIPPGRCVALTGPSGIGKSSLASLILRLYDPTSGRVMIDGIDLREMTLASVRAQIAVVLQDSILFATSVRDNIACGAPEATGEEIEAAARLANAHEFIAALPEGYDTVIGERGATLSHGQRQRIAIARAAVRRTPILILDEPTTGLDEENRTAVIDALLRLARGRTTVLITHDLSLARRADQVLVLDGGRLVESGPPAEVLGAGGRFAALARGGDQP